jgi:predicted GNAT family N-acyltransferase
MNVIFSEVISKNDLVKSFSLRVEVFVKEQGCPIYEEFDEFDEYSRLGKDTFHFNIINKNECIGTSRVILKNKDSFESAKIQRVCVAKNFRSKGIGSYMMEKLHTFLLNRNIKDVSLSSQITAINFYKNLGYIEQGDEYIDAGIVHKKMITKLNELIF